MPTKSYEKIAKQLASINQMHLLKFYDRFSDETKTAYLQHLHDLDLEQAMHLFERAKNYISCETNAEIVEMAPIPAAQFASEEKSASETLAAYRRTGLEAVSRGEVAVLLMAGGQGTRLGVPHPKGMFAVGLPSGKTLYQLHAERILKIERLAQQLTEKRGKITWYIMTSGSTDRMTDAFLQENRFFGLQPADVVQFKQGLNPCFDFEGRILLESADRVALAPDGNGGIYRALQKNGLLADMRRRGVRYVHAHSVDNILTKVADPVFVGYCVAKGADCGAKVVRKAWPAEPLGVLVRINGHIQVVEYSELSREKADLRDENGDLVYSAGNICNHFFTVDFLDKVAHEFDANLGLHVAKKKIPYCDLATGIGRIRPNAVNGIKIEKFVFDVFQLSDRFVTWEVPRTSEFSAMKNANEVGRDCPMTARNDLIGLHRRYIEASGGLVREGVEVEVSPLLSYAGEGLEEVCKGRVFEESTVLEGEGEFCTMANGR